MTDIRNESELILNPDGSIYHLNLLPGDLAETIFYVGDPDRVETVSKYFDNIEVQKSKREFVTHTGYIGKKRLSVISTGIGTDNIDIVLQEIDALLNIDFASRNIKESLSSYEIIRLGTSGALQEDIEVDSLVISSHALGLDGIMNFYKDHSNDEELLNEILSSLKLPSHFARPYLTHADKGLLNLFSEFKSGITLTCPGFYGPQGRKLRANPNYPDILNDMRKFKRQDLRITNLEMETAAIYGLANVLGHKAVSVNCILANRFSGKFSNNPEIAVDQMIRESIEKIIQ